MAQADGMGAASAARARDGLEIFLQLLAIRHDGVPPAHETVGDVLPGGVSFEEQPGVPHRIHPLRELPVYAPRGPQIAEVLEEPDAGRLGFVPSLLDALVREDRARPA